MSHFKTWMKRGEPWVWLNAGAVAISMTMVIGLLGLLAVRGLWHFWPHPVIQSQYTADDGSKQPVLGEIHRDEWLLRNRLEAMGLEVPAGIEGRERLLVKLGNRDVTGRDFSWYWSDRLEPYTWPRDAVVLERREWGHFIGFLKAIREGDTVVAEGDAVHAALAERLARTLGVLEKVDAIEKHEMVSLNYRLERLRLKQRKLELEKEWDATTEADFAAERAEIQARFSELQKDLDVLHAEVARDTLVVVTAEGTEKQMPLANIVKVSYPNALTAMQRLGEFVKRFASFLSDDPRESNTEGGIFPAIFGTVLMVLIMSIIVTPFGVVAAIYLREYAQQGWVTRIIRIAVNNLAGVPSIVYGVFGLGFFVYFLGAGIDNVFYPEAAPAPMFGTPGLLWASITLAILTVPVVIVATEEGLARIPRSVREGSLALGATKFETLWRVVLPMASPAMMTGLILAIARAAGEVAPLMLVGVVKLAPSLALDGNAPFLHLERKFMHLGFHIYDVGFQSPNVEASEPIVYATAFLLVAVIAMLNMTAIMIRNRLRERYRSLET
jgi:phosphate transport system permease protein